MRVVITRGVSIFLCTLYSLSLFVHLVPYTHGSSKLSTLILIRYRICTPSNLILAFMRIISLSYTTEVKGLAVCLLSLSVLICFEMATNHEL